MARLIMFAVLAVIILASVVFCVPAKRIMRAVIALLFVLFGVVGLYFLLDYTFLGVAQINIYADGTTMMYIFAIQLVSKRTLLGPLERWSGKHTFPATFIALVGFGIIILALLKNQVLRHIIVNGDSLPNEVTVKIISRNLTTVNKYGYVLSFEFIFVFILAYTIGGLVILNNKKKEESK